MSSKSYPCVTVSRIVGLLASLIAGVMLRNFSSETEKHQHLALERQQMAQLP